MILQQLKQKSHTSSLTNIDTQQCRSILPTEIGRKQNFVSGFEKSDEKLEQYSMPIYDMNALRKYAKLTSSRDICVPTTTTGKIHVHILSIPSERRRRTKNYMTTTRYTMTTATRDTTAKTIRDTMMATTRDTKRTKILAFTSEIISMPCQIQTQLTPALKYNADGIKVNTQGLQSINSSNLSFKVPTYSCSVP